MLPPEGDADTHAPASALPALSVIVPVIVPGWTSVTFSVFVFAGGDRMPVIVLVK